jgi:hypothetical protein
MGVSLGAYVVGIPMDHIALEALRWTVAGTTIGSGAAYALDKNVVKFISRKQ